MPASAAGPWPGPTPAPATRWRSPPTWGTTTNSTGPSPISPSAMPTRTSATTRRSPRRPNPAGWRRSRAPEPGQPSGPLRLFHPRSARPTGWNRWAISSGRTGRHGPGRRIRSVMLDGRPSRAMAQSGDLPEPLPVHDRLRVGHPWSVTGHPDPQGAWLDGAAHGGVEQQRLPVDADRDLGDVGVDHDLTAGQPGDP